MIIKHLQGGGYRLLLPPSMQCVARVALLITFSVTLVCKREYYNHPKLYEDAY